MYCKECGEEKKPVKELEMVNTYYAELECNHHIST